MAGRESPAPMHCCRLLFGVLLVISGCERSAPRETAPICDPVASEGPATSAAPVDTTPADSHAPTVRVAAVQCYSRMGAVEYNRTLLTGLIRKAAEGGAKIVVLPECAVTGYMDPGRDITWTSGTPGSGELSVRDAAEAVPGPSTHQFGALARELAIYLVVPLVEKDGEDFYNTQVLLDPQGAIAARHRKQAVWTPGDGAWVKAGALPAQVIETPFGRLGLMICYDWNVMPKKLKEAGADMVLYSVGWFGPDPQGWFRDLFVRSCVLPNGFAVVAANWSAEEGAPGWPGHGASCILGPDGALLAMSEKTRGDDVVFADIPIVRRGP